MKRNRIWAGTAVLVMASMVASACGGGGEKPVASVLPGQQTAAVTKDPVELKFLFSSDIADFDLVYNQQVKKKYPNFNITLVKATVAEAIAANLDIDILYNSITSLNPYVEAALTTDVSEIVKKYNVDLSGIEPQLLDTLRLVDNGKLIGLPYRNINLVMFYNKDLFDRFAVPYPKDGMTWEETLEIAKKMTRVDNGVQYRGFAGSLARMLGQNQYSINLVDPKTNKVNFVQDERWKTIFNTLTPLFTMPGYDATTALLADAAQQDLFRKSYTAAMWVTDHSNYPQAAESANMNWDVVSVPDYKDKKGAGQMGLATYLLVSSTSKHKDEALLAIAQLASEESQIFIAKERAGATVLKSKQIKDAFGQGNALLQNKNKKPFTPDKFAASVTFGKYYTTARTPLYNQLMEQITGKKDVNTALRDAEEAANKAIETAEKK